VDLHTLFLLALTPFAVVLLIVEYRIVRKPRAKRTAREQKFLESEMRAGAAYRKGALTTLPIATVVVAVILAFVVIPLWLTPRLVTLAAILTVGAVVIGIGGVVAAIYFNSSRGKRWIDETNQRFATAADQSRPTWFISGRAGILAGSLFTAIGLAFVVTQLLDPGLDVGFVLPAFIVLIGAAALVGGLAQRHGERATGHEEPSK